LLLKEDKDFGLMLYDAFICHASEDKAELMGSLV